MMNLSHWDLAVTFSGREAAYLLMGVDPSGPETDKHSSRHIMERLKAAYEGAVKRAEFEGYVEPCFPFEAPEPDNLMGESAILRSVVLWERLDDFREYGTPDALTGWLSQGDVLFDSQKFSRRELSRWLKENNIKSVYKFDLEQSPVLGGNESSSVSNQPEKPLTTRERTSYLNIIGALLAQLTAGKANDTTVITQAVTDYPGKQGISQRKLQEAFAAAKRSLGAS